MLLAFFTFIVFFVFLTKFAPPLGSGEVWPWPGGRSAGCEPVVSTPPRRILTKSLCASAGSVVESRSLQFKTLGYHPIDGRKEALQDITVG